MTIFSFVAALLMVEQLPTIEIVAQYEGVDGGHYTDFDDDGDVDFIIVSEEGCSVSIFLQTAPFKWEQDVIAEGLLGPEDAVTADCDGDGDLDIAVVNDEQETPNCELGGMISILWNDGGQWTPQTLFLGQGAVNVAAFDVDNDGDEDAIISDKEGGVYRLFLNPGDRAAAWQMKAVETDISVAGAYEVLPYDMDGDGDLDIVGTARFSGKVFWLENDSTGADFWPGHEIGDAPDPNHLFITDLDGDGKIEILYSAWGGESGYFSQGQKSWEKTVIHRHAKMVGIAAADVENDGQFSIYSMQYLPTENAVLFEHKRTKDGKYSERILAEGFAQTDELWPLSINGGLYLFGTSNHHARVGSGKFFRIDISSTTEK